MQKIITFVVAVFTCISVSANNLYDYNLLESKVGYGLYEKDGIYVQRINLKQVDLRFVHGNKSGNNFQKGALTNWWSNLYQIFSSDLISVNNLSFFESLSGSTTELSFPYKSLGNINTMGASNSFSHAWKMLAIKDLCYDNKPCPLITDYDSNTLNSNHFNNVIVGLDPFDSDVIDNTTGKRGNVGLGRTYAGVSYDIPSTPILYVVVAKTATNNDMTNTLFNLGVMADNMVMFDGSGSSQLKTQTVSVYGDKNPLPAYYQADYRKIPQVMVITSK